MIVALAGEKIPHRKSKKTQQHYFSSQFMIGKFSSIETFMWHTFRRWILSDDRTEEKLYFFIYDFPYHFTNLLVKTTLNIVEIYSLIVV